MAAFSRITIIAFGNKTASKVIIHFNWSVRYDCSPMIYHDIWLNLTYFSGAIIIVSYIICI